MWLSVQNAIYLGLLVFTMSTTFESNIQFLNMFASWEGTSILWGTTTLYKLTYVDWMYGCDVSFSCSTCNEGKPMSRISTIMTLNVCNFRILINFPVQWCMKHYLPCYYTFYLRYCTFWRITSAPLPYSGTSIFNALSSSMYILYPFNTCKKFTQFSATDL